MPPDTLAGLATAAPPRSYRSIHPATAAIRRPSPIAGNRPAETMRWIDRIIAGLVLLAVITTFTISSAMLTNWKIHYVTTGGGFYEKFHPATYFSFLAFGLLLIRNNDPIGEINRMFLRCEACAGLSVLLVLHADSAIGAGAPVYGHRRYASAACRAVPCRLAPLAGAEIAIGVGVSPYDAAQHRPWLLRILLRSPADTADARRRGRVRRMALLCSVRPPAHRLGHRRRLHSSARFSSSALSAGLSAAAPDRILPGVADGIRRPDRAHYGIDLDRLFRRPRNIPYPARRPHLAAGRRLPRSACFSSRPRSSLQRSTSAFSTR